MLLRRLCCLMQVDFFTSMDLPYKAISHSEAEDLAEDLMNVLSSIGDFAKAQGLKKKPETTQNFAQLDIELSKEE